MVFVIQQQRLKQSIRLKLHLTSYYLKCIKQMYISLKKCFLPSILKASSFSTYITTCIYCVNIDCITYLKFHNIVLFNYVIICILKFLTFIQSIFIFKVANYPKIIFFNIKVSIIIIFNTNNSLQVGQLVINAIEKVLNLY